MDGEWTISMLSLGEGQIGIAPVPGRTGRYERDLTQLLEWGPQVVLTMTTLGELSRVGADGLGDDLRTAGIDWRHLPVPDFGKPPDDTAALWPAASRVAHDALADGGRVLAHCFGGCGRSGMALMRLMVEAGELPDYALVRLRDVRSCAVETEDQRAWAAAV